VASLFEASTIAGQAVLFEHDEDEHGDLLGEMLSLREPDFSQSATQRPLFCIHPITGLSLGYSSLLRYLDSSLPVYGLQACGLRGETQLPNSIDEIAADYLIKIRRIQPVGPYRLLGRSLGGLIAHAMAAQLCAQGERVELLAMIDSYLFAPAGIHDPADEARAALDFLGIAADDNAMPRNLDELAPILLAHSAHSMPLLQEIMRDHPHFVKHAFAVMHNNFALARRYVPRKIDLDVMYFHAIQRLGGLSGVVEHNPEIWADHIGGRFELHVLDCHHESVLDAEPAAHIGQVLRERMDLMQRSTARVPNDDTQVRQVAHA
jgi:enterobactin synthetase component F